MESFRPFVLLTTHRSGSSVLRSTLDRHRSIWLKGELVRDGAPSHHSYSQSLKGSSMARFGHRLAPAWSMRRFLTRTLAPRKGIAAAGFKLMYDQITPAVQDWIDEREDLGFVHLIRQNRLKTLISIAGAQGRNRYSVKQDEQFDFQPIHLPVDGLLEELATLDARIARHRGWVADRSHLEVHYEDFQESAMRVLNAIYGFLGVASDILEEPSELRLRKMTPEAPSEALSNYEEVAKTVAGTPYERFLE